ncbi:hypothetical protein KHQ81_10555 [Mycoplasmatota bacterium]|nr:hypothetical protein KHQ81_10555 [Mycoplasmatota bacterium]
MGFKKIFIGTILILQDFKILGLNILPDFIGYIIIFIGLSEIIHLSSKFKIAKIMSFILIFLSIPDIYFIPIPFIPYYFFKHTIIYTVIYIIFSYFLFIGIKETATSIHNSNLAKMSLFSWLLAVVSGIGSVIIIINPFFMILIHTFMIVTLVIQLFTLSMAKYIK